MSGKFDGFSEDDINKLATSRSNKTSKTQFTRKSGIRRIPSADNKNDVVIDALPIHKIDPKSSVITKTVSAMNQESNNLNDMTNFSSISLEESIHFRPLTTTQTKMHEKIDETSGSGTVDESILHIEKLQENFSNKNNNNMKDNHFVSSLSPFRGISLKDFEAQRKIIEEQNKQKKEILYKAIELHSQKTAAEVKKIEQIKSELAKLDSDLAADVAILRKQIEAACINYANIQKQYDRIESQFLKAKLELHNASERKELLTEHLCTVIAHNEDRKAKKLSELMEKVGLSPSGNQVGNLNE